MMDSREVHTGDPFRTEQINRPVRDIADLGRRVQALEQAVTKHKSQPCRNCLSPTFFVGVYEITDDNDDGTYDLKEKYVSNTGTTESAKLTTADKNTSYFGRTLVATALNGSGGEADEGDEVLVFGAFDAGTSSGEPIIRYFFEFRGGPQWTASTTGTAVGDGDASALAYPSIWIDTDESVCGESRLFIPFALDGGDATPYVIYRAADLWVEIGSSLTVIREAGGANYVQVTGALRMAAIMEAWTPATLTWANQPAVSPGAPRLLGLVEWMNETYNAVAWAGHVQFQCGVIGPTTIYGFRLSCTLTLYGSFDDAKQHADATALTATDTFQYITAKP